MDDWYYQRGGSTFGPISARQLLALRDRGSLSEETPLRRGLSGEWSPLKEAALSEVVAHEPPPIPATAPMPRQPSTTKPSTGRLVSDGPSGWLWFFGIMAVILLTAHALVLSMNAFSFALVMLPAVELPDLMYQALNFCSEGLILSTAGFFLCLILWQGAAFSSLARVYGENNVPHGSGSGFWWLCPFANLVMPFRCLRVMRHLSRRLREAPGAEPSASLSVLGIHTAFIAATVLRVLCKVSELPKTQVNLASEEANPMLSMLFDLALAALAFQLAIFVLINLIQQVRLFRSAQDDPAS
jgi:hypothetical protein